MTRRTRVVGGLWAGRVCAAADAAKKAKGRASAVRAQGSRVMRASRQAVFHGDVLGFQLEAGRPRLEQEELREIGVALPVPDEGLHEVPGDRRELQRDAEAAPRVEPQVEILAQELRREGH